MPNQSPAVVHVDPGYWQANHAYGSSSLVRPTGILRALNGFQYLGQGVIGTSGGVEPTWPVIIGATVVDNTMTWTCNSELAIPSQVGLPNITIPLNGDTGVPQGIVNALASVTDWLGAIWKYLSSGLAPNASFTNAGQLASIGGAGSSGSNSGYAFVGSNPNLGLGTDYSTSTSASPIPGFGPQFTTQTFAVSFKVLNGGAGIASDTTASVTGIQLPATLANAADAQIRATLSGGTQGGLVVQQANITSTSTCAITLYNAGTGATASATTWTVTITVYGGDV